MRKGTEKVASKNSLDYEKLNEVDALIIRRQQRAEIKRVENRNTPTPANQTLTQEFFEGLDIV